MAVAAKKRSSRLLAALVAAAVLLAVSVFLGAEPLRAALMTEQLRALSAHSEESGQEIKRLNMELAHERATRSAIEAQMDAMADELKRSRKELLFYKESSSRTGR